MTYNDVLFKKFLIPIFACVVLFAGYASATPMEPNVIMTITATSGTRSATLDFDTGIAWSAVMGGPDTMIWDWNSPWMPSNPMLLEDGEGILGEIQQLSCGVKKNPQVNLGFAVTANSTDTVFTISSDVVNFSSLTNPDAVATARIGVTDSDNNGVDLTGAYTSGKSYQALYNMGPSVWAELIDGVSAGAGDSNSINARQPLSGFGSISGSVTSIRSEFHFTLSAYDQADGTSAFGVIIPEPTTAILFGLGFMATLLRRSRK